MYSLAIIVLAFVVIRLKLYRKLIVVHRGFCSWAPIPIAILLSLSILRGPYLLYEHKKPELVVGIQFLKGALSFLVIKDEVLTGELPEPHSVQKATHMPKEAFGIQLPFLNTLKLPGESQIRGQVPIWLFWVPLFAVWILLIGRMRLRLRHPFCLSCKYCLSGAAHQRCPECGTPIPEEQKQSIA
ncbi:hypothetical protein B7486_01120 [cyanobacterium TDX16]|nr:hypothetical protein B7486_01120 [cyanobacterium TDX16]